MAPLCSVVLTAVKRQAPQHIWPQGAMVAFVGGLKQIGQVYSASSSGARGGGGTGVSVGVGVGVGVGWWWCVLKEDDADTVVDGMVSKSGKGDGESVFENVVDVVDELVEPNLTRTISSSSSLSCASRFGLRSLCEPSIRLRFLVVVVVADEDDEDGPGSSCSMSRKAEGRHVTRTRTNSTTTTTGGRDGATKRRVATRQARLGRASAARPV
jgi:hypothetical protein